MARAKQIDEWDRTAWLCFWIPKFSKRKFQPKDFHPFMMEQTRTSLKKLDEIIASGALPEKLSNEKILAICDRHIKEDRDAARRQ